MNRIAIVVLPAVLALGCANTPKGKAIQLVVASDAAADEIAAGYKGYVETKTIQCQDKLDPEVNTKEEAKDCLGVASSAGGERLKKILEVLVAAQLVIKLAVECESNPLKVPQEFREKCVDAKKADWRLMVDTLMSAWDGLKPYFEAVRGGK